MTIGPEILIPGRRFRSCRFLFNWYRESKILIGYLQQIAIRHNPVLNKWLLTRRHQIIANACLAIESLDVRACGHPEHVCVHDMEVNAGLCQVVLSDT